MLDDAAYITALMKHNTDALGFIPTTAIRHRFVRQNQHRIIRNAANRRIGYLLIGPLRAYQPLHIHQACVDLDHRRRHHAARTLQHLITQAVAHNIPEIRLRCALDLQANHFWAALGFQLTAITTGGQRRNRLIAHYALALLDPHPLFNPPNPHAPSRLTMAHFLQPPKTPPTPN